MKRKTLIEFISESKYGKQAIERANMILKDRKGVKEFDLFDVRRGVHYIGVDFKEEDLSFTVGMVNKTVDGDVDYDIQSIKVYVPESGDEIGIPRDLEQKIIKQYSWVLDDIAMELYEYEEYGHKGILRKKY